MDEIKLKDCLNMHEGEDFLVCGMGTSIDLYPKEFYENFPGVTVGVNEITDLFEPDYHLPNFEFYPEHERQVLAKDSEAYISFDYMSPSAAIEIERTGKLSKRGTVAMPAFTLAYQLGARRIFLIGIDFLPNADGQIYFKQCTKKAKSYYQLADSKDPELQATLRCFEDGIAQYWSQGVEVYNMSTNSRLQSAPGISKETYAGLLDIRRRRALGWG